MTITKILQLESKKAQFDAESKKIGRYLDLTKQIKNLENKKDWRPQLRGVAGFTGAALLITSVAVAIYFKTAILPALLIVGMLSSGIAFRLAGGTLSPGRYFPIYKGGPFAHFMGNVGGLGGVAIAVCLVSLPAILGGSLLGYAFTPTESYPDKIKRLEKERQKLEPH